VVVGARLAVDRALFFLFFMSLSASRLVRVCVREGSQVALGCRPRGPSDNDHCEKISIIVVSFVNAQQCA
jgi:hypothetical protein